jgi:hypothetical protein
MPGRTAGVSRPGDDPEDTAVLHAIAGDRRLTARQRSALREVYEAFVASAPPGPKTRK